MTKEQEELILLEAAGQYLCADNDEILLKQYNCLEKIYENPKREDRSDLEDEIVIWEPFEYEDLITIRNRIQDMRYFLKVFIKRYNAL